MKSLSYTLSYLATFAQLMRVGLAVPRTPRQRPPKFNVGINIDGLLVDESCSSPQESLILTAWAWAYQFAVNSNHTANWLLQQRDDNTIEDHNEYFFQTAPATAKLFGSGLSHDNLVDHQSGWKDIIENMNSKSGPRRDSNFPYIILACNPQLYDYGSDADPNTDLCSNGNTFAFTTNRFTLKNNQFDYMHVQDAEDIINFCPGFFDPSDIHPQGDLHQGFINQHAAGNYYLETFREEGPGTYANEDQNQAHFVHGMLRGTGTYCLHEIMHLQCTLGLIAPVSLGYEEGYTLSELATLGLRGYDEAKQNAHSWAVKSVWEYYNALPAPARVPPYKCDFWPTDEDDEENEGSDEEMGSDSGKMIKRIFDLGHATTLRRMYAGI